MPSLSRLFWMPLLLALAGCGQPQAGPGEQVVRRSGYDQSGRPVPRHILEDRRYTENPRYWDRNGDFIGDTETAGEPFNQREWEREQMEDDYRHRRFVEYIRDCTNCAAPGNVQGEPTPEKKPPAR